MAVGVCSEPVRIPEQPELCAMCAHRIVDHAPETLGRRDASEDAVWAWFVANGGIWDVFGGVRLTAARASAVREHLRRCAIDLDASSQPGAQPLDEFVDTDAGTRSVDGVVGSISCECGAVVDQEWVVVTDKGAAAVLAEMLQLAGDATR